MTTFENSTLHFTILDVKSFYRDSDDISFLTSLLTEFLSFSGRLILPRFGSFYHPRGEADVKNEKRRNPNEEYE